VKFYTRSGDTGDTSLYGGGRIKKSDIRVDAYGGVDELNSVIGLARSIIRHEQTKQILLKEQLRLFRLGADLATPLDAKTPKPINRISDSDVKEVEDTISTLQAKPPNRFVVPGSSTPSALLHVARAVCRRVERQVWALYALDKNTNQLAAVYLNRLSSLLFTLAININQLEGVNEDYWNP
jgi:cob(I)alamin adenosyltransferase